MPIKLWAIEYIVLYDYEGVKLGEYRTVLFSVTSRDIGGSEDVLCILFHVV